MQNFQDGLKEGWKNFDVKICEFDRILADVTNLRNILVNIDENASNISCKLKVMKAKRMSFFVFDRSWLNMVENLFIGFILKT